MLVVQCVLGIVVHAPPDVLQHLPAVVLRHCVYQVLDEHAFGTTRWDALRSRCISRPAFRMIFLAIANMHLSWSRPDFATADSISWDTEYTSVVPDIAAFSCSFTILTDWCLELASSAVRCLPGFVRAPRTGNMRRRGCYRSTRLFLYGSKRLIKPAYTMTTGLVESIRTSAEADLFSAPATLSAQPSPSR